MDSKFTDKEHRVIEYFRNATVCTISEIIQKLELSRRTIFRALNKSGYYSSYNYNARYYTLQEIAKFDNYGLWKYNDIGFSKYNSITDTITWIINESEAGYTNTEMSQLLGTETNNLLSRLCNQNRIEKFFIGRKAVYLSTDSVRNEAQQQSRTNQRLSLLEQSQTSHWAGGMLPQGIDAMTVIPVLTGMIQRPHISIASLSMSLQAQNVKVTAEQIRNIISFYGLEKKRYDRSGSISQSARRSRQGQARRSIAIAP